MRDNVLPTKILTASAKALYDAGMNVYRIADELKISSAQVVDIVGCGDRKYPDKPLDESIAQQILYDAGKTMTVDTIVSIERERYAKYALIEQKSLDIMAGLLEHYGNIPPGQDDDIDRFKAQLATNFIKATQQCRDEILKKYEIDKEADNKSKNKLQIEFIQPRVINN